MNHYRHMMEQVALSDRKKEEIMEQLETMETKKRRMPKARTIILAAALAVGCVLSIAAGLPARVYNFATGGQVYVSPDSSYGSMTVDMADFVAPIKAENGRLWFEADGLTVDITDKVDENTPYIYERTDPGTGEKGYVIAGGTAEDFGWAELFIIDGELNSVSGDNFEDIMVRLPDGSEVDRDDLTDEQWEQLAGQNGTNTDAEAGPISDGAIAARVDIRPWFQAALDQLGLEWW